LRGFDRPQRYLHVGFVEAGNDDVVAVVADGRRNRAALEAEIAQEAMGDIAVRLAVALDHSDETKTVLVKMRLPAVLLVERDCLVAKGDARQFGADRVDRYRFARQVRCQLDRFRQLYRLVGGGWVLV